MDNQNLDAIAREVHMSYYSKGIFGKDREEIKEICQRTGVDKETAKQAIERIKHPYGKDYKPEIKRKCPNCNGTNFHAFVEDKVIRQGKTKVQTSVNLNPLKPFTVFNHKEKVVREPWTMQVSKFVCDDCGKIFQ